MFSFNAPFGACPTCNGLGFTQKLDPKLLIDETKSIDEGALQPILGTMEFSGFYRQLVDALIRDHGRFLPPAKGSAKEIPTGTLLRHR